MQRRNRHLTWGDRVLYAALFLLLVFWAFLDGGLSR